MVPDSTVVLPESAGRSEFTGTKVEPVMTTLRLPEMRVAIPGNGFASPTVSGRETITFVVPEITVVTPENSDEEVGFIGMVVAILIMVLDGPSTAGLVEGFWMPPIEKIADTITPLEGTERI